MSKHFLTCSEYGEKFPFESHEHICKTPFYDKNQNIVKVGDKIRISNSRNSYNQEAIVFRKDDGQLGYKLLTGTEKGKCGTLEMWKSAIWRANDKPENWIEVIRGAI